MHRPTVASPSRALLAGFMMAPVCMIIWMSCSNRQQFFALRDTLRALQLSPMTEACNRMRYRDINSMSLMENDFIPYKCYTHKNQFATILGMALKPFNESRLTFSLDGHRLGNLSIHADQWTFAITAEAGRKVHCNGEKQTLTYTIDKCSYQLECENHYPARKEELNMCVYTKRSLEDIEGFLAFYHDFADRIFIYNNNRDNEASFSPLRYKQRKYEVIPWYLDDLRDPNISPLVYDELVARNYRNYSRDAQKVQANDCIYRNRNTDMVLMIDDDEYLNYHDRSFYRSLYQELRGRYDDILLYRNYCNTTVAVETRLSTVFDKPTARRCAKSKRKRLEKAFVLPANCPLYEIHRCTTKNSYSLKHLNIYLAHKPYA